MRNPCAIININQAESLGLVYHIILPGICIVPYITETRAKEDAKKCNGIFARIDIDKVFL